MIVVAAERRGEASLDTIRYGEQYFLTQVGVGIDSRMIRDTDRESQIAPRPLGLLRFFLPLADEAPLASIRRRRRRPADVAPRAADRRGERGHARNAAVPVGAGYRPHGRRLEPSASTTFAPSRTTFIWRGGC